MHGFDQHADQMSSLVNQIQTLIPDIYIRNCEVGDGENATVFMTIENQVNELITCILNDPKLANGFIAFGYSNGGMLMRSYLEHFNHLGPKILRFITYSAPLGGFFCGGSSTCVEKAIPPILDDLVADIIYTRPLQTLIGPTNYWRDPYNLDLYKKHCAYLPALENIINYSQQMKDNFLSPDLFVFFGSNNDGAISPWESAWFGAFSDNQDEIVLQMEERDVYAQDLFGLKTLNEQERVKRINTGLTHLQFDTKEFVGMFVPWLVME
ncbi:Palmitoyl-protein_thioesterase [Hexamita inflata]|uniref:Palmitoyl-protein thioesterase 1 n=1 Tax=Hexamita inflata TaxID=28002 RepID=A0AA86P4Q6_9EUKA|nr:Palmitoyl-protein thioesterase [Hexamita inflata]